MSIEVRNRTPARVAAEVLFQMHAAAYMFTVVLCTVIWLATGAGAFWPFWVAFPWGLGLAFHGWATWALPAHFRR